MGHVNITHMLCSHIYSWNILHTSTMRSSNLVAHHVSYWEWWNYQTVVILAHMSCPMSLSDHVVLASLCLSSQIHPLCLSIRPGHSGIISVWSQNICAWNIYLIWCNQNKLRVIFPLKREYNFDYINVSYHWEYSSHRRSLRKYIFICTLLYPIYNICGNCWIDILMCDTRATQSTQLATAFLLNISAGAQHQPQILHYVTYALWDSFSFSVKDPDTKVRFIGLRDRTVKGQREISHSIYFEVVLSPLSSKGNNTVY